MREVYVFGSWDCVGLSLRSGVGVGGEGVGGYWSVFDVDLGRGFFWEWSGC